MKKLFTIIFIFFVYVSVNAQNNPPVAINDTIITISELNTTIDVLLNDYDPDDDEIEIRNVRNPEHGDADDDGQFVYYRSDPYVGQDSIKYRIRDVDGNNSEYAWIFISVDSNPDIPIAESDEFEAVKLVPTNLNVLDNDTDPNGDEVKIYEVNKLGFGYNVEISEDSLSVLFTSGYPLDKEDYEFEYRIIEKNTENEFYSDWVSVFVESIENPDIPTAVFDEYETEGGVPIDCYVLENDINPSGGTLNLIIHSEPEHGTIEILDDHIVYTPFFSYVGEDSYVYKVFLEEFPYLYDVTTNIIHVTNNPSRPVAINDTSYGNCGEEIFVNVLANDYDPDGAEIELKETGNASFVNVWVIGNKAVYSPMVVVNTDSDQFRYRINEINNPDSYSEWATVTLNLEQNSDYPITVKDYASVVAGQSIEIDVLENDLLNDFNPEVWVSGESEYGLVRRTENNTLIVTPYMSSKSTTAKIRYTLRDNPVTYISIGEIEVQISSNNSYDSLNINNINAGIHSDGYLFCKYNEVIDIGPDDFKPHFEFPKGSGLNTIFSSAIWIGGLDNNDSLHLAAQRYKQVGYDFQFGPVSNNYSGENYFTKWSRLWKLNKTDVDFHRNNYWKEDYIPKDEIITWPGNGDTENGQAEHLAPFYDKDNNGLYEPMEGDYPLIRGDQTVFFIFNDDRPHTETMGGSMKIEIHGMAYAYNTPEDELLNNTIFVHYDVYNRSQNTFYNTYFGLFTDLDIGYSWDDYVGSNVLLGSYYGYNGAAVDGNNEPGSYGNQPPTQSVTMVAGPFMDSDNIDNPANDCDFSENGLNFGDGIVDNERLGMVRFTCIYNYVGVIIGDPVVAPQYYNYLRGFWKDGSPIMYGGNGHLDYSAEGPECRFMFPGSSDPCNWGTDGQLPNGGYNQNGKYWTEEEVLNSPSDRRGLGVSGPFTFKPGDIQEIELAFAAGQGDGNTISGYDQLINNLTNLFSQVNEGEIIVPNEFLSVSENDAMSNIVKVYPNPSKNIIYVNIAGESAHKVEYSIYNMIGTEILNDYMIPDLNNAIDISKLETGIYIIYVEFDNEIYQNKFIKM